MLKKKITVDHEWIVRVLLSKAKGMVVKYDRVSTKARFYYLYGLLTFVKYKLYY